MRFVLLTVALASSCLAAEQVKISQGLLEGTRNDQTGVRSFKGVPFAKPPVGNLRWTEPQPPKPWEGVRQAVQFGPRCTQEPLFSDMVFRSNGISEDCLYLNVWTPAKTGKEKLPVLVYFYGGGFSAGDGSENRYDGESMATKAIVALTVNYRLGVFGFLAHSELTRESPHHASGNYALLDQHAALEWVQKNISAFGGDPKKVTIAGESAGSISVSYQMASPLSRDLIHGAIGESGAGIKPTLYPVPLEEGQAKGARFAAGNSIAQLRAMTAQQILELVKTSKSDRFPPVVDGYFLPELPAAIFAEGRQAHVPLLVGWNSQENDGSDILGKQQPTPENFARAATKLYGEAIVKLYAGDVQQAATDLASDRFISFSTWKWADLCAKTGGKPVYRYFYTHPRPGSRGASHSAEVEYAMGNLATNKVYQWTPEDYQVSKTMQEYFVNFIRKGDPNGAGLVKWPDLRNKQQFLRIDVKPEVETEQHRDRYQYLDQFYSK